MKSFSFFLSIIIVAIIGYGAYFFYNQTYEQTMLEMQNAPPLSTIPSVDPGMLEATESASPSAIPSDWKIYRSAKYDYSIRIPYGMKTETNSEGDRFYWFGVTQSLGTELYDGISLVIKKGRMNNKTLKEAAETQHSRAAKEETTESISPVVAVTVGEYQGYQFRKSSIGSGDFIYLPISKDEYLEIINMTVQPKDSGESYNEIVKKMFSTLEIND